LVAAAAALLLCHRFGTPQRPADHSPPAWSVVPVGRRPPTSALLLCGGGSGALLRPLSSPATAPMSVELRAAEADLIPADLELQFDPNSIIDMTEKELIGTTLRLKSSVFGFPNFQSLMDLRGDGTVYFYGGMISREPGNWCVVEGDPENGERPDDLYLEFTQPLTERYKKAFQMPKSTCFWRAKLEVRKDKKKGPKFALEGGQVVSESEKGDLVSEGVFTAESVSEDVALEVQRKSAEAFERALTTPKAESTGFKTPAAIAGIKTSRADRQLTAGKDELAGLLEDDKSRR